MSHLNSVSKRLPAAAALPYLPPQGLLDVRSWGDIIVTIGLILEKKFGADMLGPDFPRL